MNDRIMMTSIICGSAMYCVAVVCITIHSTYHPAETGESAATKIIAVFGPLITLFSALMFRRNGPPAASPSPPRQNAQEK